MKNLLLAIILGASATATHAVDKTFTGTSGGNWSTSGNWTPSGVPTAADKAIIPSDKTVHVDITSAVADTIDVDGVLHIDAGKKLTLDNDASIDSTIDGEVRLSDDDSELAVIEANHTFAGTGQIVGESDGALITIGASVVVRNELATANEGIRGAMIIRGLTASGQTNGTFNNRGLVEATKGTIELHADTILNDHNTPGVAQWRAPSLGSTLKFARTAAGLNGDFDLECGTIELNASVNIKTCGTFTWNAGRLIIGSSGLFEYAAYAGTCSNPDTDSDSGSCASPFGVSGAYDVSCGSCS